MKLALDSAIEAMIKHSIESNTLKANVLRAASTYTVKPSIWTVNTVPV